MAVGVASVALGVLGMFLPVLPTTPFLLLAAFCFSRSSERLHRWLTGNRWFGPILHSYQTGRGIPRRAKTLAMVTLWPTIAIAAFVLPFWPVKALVVAIAAAVTLHILRLPTTPDRPVREEPSEA